MIAFPHLFQLHPDQLITEDPIDLKEQVSIVAQTFSDFVPGAKMHLTATNADDDKENAPTAAPITLEDAATDLQVGDVTLRWNVWGRVAAAAAMKENK